MEQERKEIQQNPPPFNKEARAVFKEVEKHVYNLTNELLKLRHPSNVWPVQNALMKVSELVDWSKRAVEAYEYSLSVAPKAAAAPEQTTKKVKFRSKNVAN
jgi:hypothetical protein